MTAAQGSETEKTLTLISGVPPVGTTVTLGVDNPLGTQPLGTRPFLAV